MTPMNFLPDFLPWPYAELPYEVHAVYAAFIFPLAYLYSLALTRGMACACDEQHRMTPLSPWSYFWMKSKRLLILTACLAPPCLLVANVFTFSEFFGGTSTWGEAIARIWRLRIMSGGYDRPRFIWIYISSPALMSLIFTTITLIAPRNSSPLLSATFGLSLGLLLFWIYIAAIQRTSGDLAKGLSYLFPLLAILSLILTWLYVRFRLDRAWFRFENS